MNNQICPLCQETTNLWLVADHSFFLCPKCKLVSKDNKLRITPEQEKARYEKHNNDPLDRDYQSFLRRLTDPLLPFVAQGSLGLDFGCGPTKGIEFILTAHGHKVKSYDPFFFPTIDLQAEKFDFVTSSEVFEHLFNPRKELELINSLLKVGGILAIMTSTYPAIEIFPDWYYRKDPTHLCFYSKETFEFIANEFGWELMLSKTNCFYFKKLSVC